jgi:hypothetical protein
MTRFQYIILGITTLCSLCIWAVVLYKKNTPTIEPITIVTDIDAQSFTVSTAGQTYALSDGFWKWEAQGRRRLIDNLIDDPKLTFARDSWGEGIAVNDGLLNLANHLISIQFKAYQADPNMTIPDVILTSLRGEANGLYIPQDKAIYINTKMKWGMLPFERFVEVILHENMHHIMSWQSAHMDEADPLYNDFMALHLVGYHHRTQAMNVDKHGHDNPQEWVAYKMQDVAGFAGVANAKNANEKLSIAFDGLRLIQENYR